MALKFKQKPKIKETPGARDVAIDWDGTLVRSKEVFCSIINQREDLDLDPKEIKDYDYWWKENLGDEFWSTLDFIDKNDIQAVYKPYDRFTVPTLFNIAETFGVVNIITCNEKRARSGIKKWLSSRGLLDRTSITTLGRVDHDRKLEEPYDTYIDDSPELAEAITGREEQLILMNAPWNEPEDLSSKVQDARNIIRARSWKECWRLLTGADEP